jgi:hypothetical protein
VSRRTVYLVQRRAVAFQEVREDTQALVLCPPSSYSGADSGPAPLVPLRLFDDRARAEAYRRERERAARRDLSPFDLGEGVGELTSLDEAGLQDRILELGLMPPLAQPVPYEQAIYTWIDWSGWWRRTVGCMTEAQRDAIWDLLDHLRLYEVVALELEE